MERFQRPRCKDLLHFYYSKVLGKLSSVSKLLSRLEAAIGIEHGKVMNGIDESEGEIIFGKIVKQDIGHG